MIKRNRLLCDICNSAIKSTKSMTEEDWKNMEMNNPTLCIRCETPTRLLELESLKPYMNSDKYWKRKKELELIISNL